MDDLSLVSGGCTWPYTIVSRLKGEPVLIFSPQGLLLVLNLRCYVSFLDASIFPCALCSKRLFLSQSGVSKNLFTPSVQLSPHVHCPALPFPSLLRAKMHALICTSAPGGSCLLFSPPLLF